MGDWNPQVVKIEKIEKHNYADNLSIATVLGDYPVVIKTGDYNVNDIIAYLPIDTIVPDNSQFYFLCPKNTEKYYDENEQIKSRILGPKYPIGEVPEKYRIIKAKKIRNIYSQGMIASLPLNHNLNIGDSIIELFELKKHEEIEEENIPKFKNSNAEKPPTNFSIPYYDIEGLRKVINELNIDQEIVLTEKLHGSNAAFCYANNRLYVKSRNLYKKIDESDMWWDIAIRYELENKLSKFTNYVFFGEIIGHLKGFPYDSFISNGKLHTTIHFFDIFDTKTNFYLDYDLRVDMIRSAGLSPVPELYRGPWIDKEQMYLYAEGKSTLNKKHIREGFVLNTTKEIYNSTLHSRMQVKLVGQEYNLKK
jgi:RNA ligase (TIGR02306 family)